MGSAAKHYCTYLAKNSIKSDEYRIRENKSFVNVYMNIEIMEIENEMGNVWCEVQ